MPKFKTQPGIIEAVQVYTHTDWPAGVRIGEAQGYEVYNALHDTWIKFKAGDWINVTKRGDYYPIDAEVFKTRYTLCDGE